MPNYAPLYRKLRSKFYPCKLAHRELDNIAWRRSLLAEMAPRPLTPRPKLAPWATYTDAATSSSVLCALFFDTSAPAPPFIGRGLLVPTSHGATFTAIPRAS